jgi:molybdate transport system regulatory protein
MRPVVHRALTGAAFSVKAAFMPRKAHSAVPNSNGLRFRIVLKPGFILGPGKADLLEAIAETGSLTAATVRYGMSYKRGWTLIQEMNKGFGAPVIETQKGGTGGGGHAELTPLGRLVLDRYRRMEADAAAAVSAGVADLRRHMKPAALPAKKSTPSRRGAAK